MWAWAVIAAFGLLIIVAVVAMFRGAEERPVTADPAPPGPLATVPVPHQPVAVEHLPAAEREFAAFAGRWDAQRDPMMQQSYVIDGVMRLISIGGAIHERNQLGPDVRRQLDSLQQQAARLQATDPFAPEHPRRARDAFAAGADVFTAIAETPEAPVPIPRDHIHEMRSSAQAIDTDRPLIEQTERVTSFFQAASAVIQGAV